MGPPVYAQNAWRSPILKHRALASQPWCPLLANALAELLLFLNACKAQLLDG